VLFAVPQELGPFAQRITPTAAPRPDLPMVAPRGRIGEYDVVCLAGGMGPKRAAAAAEALLRVWKPDLLIMAGVAGALSPELSVADLVVADAVLSGEEVLIPTEVLSLSGASYRTGPLLSLDRVLVTAEEKRAAVTGHPAPLAVEMETAAVARVAAAIGVPWSAVRAVSDTAVEALPLDFNRLRGADGDLPTSRVALAAVSNPRSIPGLIRLGRNTNLAAKALAEFLAGWIESRSGHATK
jgi:adenosylhomocysteine nucleosidase